MKKQHWLITAFDPFAGRSENNSEIVLQEMKALTSELEHTPDWPFQFHYHILPVEYDRCFEVTLEQVQQIEKKHDSLSGILALGEGAEDFKIETQANNLDDVPGFPDNAGTVRKNKKIFNDLEKHHAFELNFPFEAFSKIRTSTSAGHFVCNHLCAKLSRHHEDKKNPPHLGFIHVPRKGMGGMFTADLCAVVIVNGFKKLL